MKINEILNIKYPFLQGGMAHVATGEFAAAVSNAGGLGIIGSGGMTAAQLKEEIKILRTKTEKPFGVNILLLHREIEEICQIVCDFKVPVLTTGAGNPGKYIDLWKSHNIKVFPVVSSTALAKRMERLGVDGLIAEGQEAGGHIGELGSMVLIDEVASSVNLPVIAAGGIGKGKHVLAAEVLGAVGVQMGTRLLVAEECPIHPDYKNRILTAKSIQNTVIGRIKGLPVRVLKNHMSRKYIKMEQGGASMEELELMTFSALQKAVHTGDVNNGSLMCGQVVGSAKKIQPLKEIFEEIYQEYKEAKETLWNQ
ncbi:MAG: nitronate monooxygenase [Tissierellia bacterium]|nr:nitronate monooxygenase [Tissierellia bacterium]